MSAEMARCALVTIDELPKWFKAAREQRGESLRAAAEVTGISHATLSRIERRVEPPSLATLKSMLAYIGGS